LDECIVGYTGKCGAKTTAKGKPKPVGFKIWVIAQAFYPYSILHTGPYGIWNMECNPYGT
jgi:hypothetical protein